MLKGTIAGWFYLLTGLSQCYLTILKVTDHPADSARISSAAVVINIILNAILIFGLFGAPAMGVRGAALATLTARIIEFLWCVLLSLKKGYLCFCYPRPCMLYVQRSGQRWEYSRRQ